ncbi:MAG: hypothetical protein ACI4VK_03760 [Candidatus Coproplasma sp.]
MAKKEKKQDDLDTETTFADMNVEGFRWYDPNRKKNGGKKTNNNKVSRKEYWAMVRAAFVAYIPVFVIVIAVFGIVACIAWLWVG